MLVYLGTAVPYLLNAYNPLFGGTLTAKYVMPMGWGEAVSASAHWLAEQPGRGGKNGRGGHWPRVCPIFPWQNIVER
ncbi:MAG: hypothetical protein H6656_13755 [Ardenticatenaceae bacterium]|nr:hypothetical protein [Ardenticatenaceae bacterium]